MIIFFLLAWDTDLQDCWWISSTDSQGNLTSRDHIAVKDMPSLSGLEGSSTFRRLELDIPHEVTMLF